MKEDPEEEDATRKELDVDSEEEHSYHDSEEEVDEVAEQLIADEPENLNSSENVGGHTLGSWGTGKQGGFN